MQKATVPSLAPHDAQTSPDAALKASKHCRGRAWKMGLTIFSHSVPGWDHSEWVVGQSGRLNTPGRTLPHIRSTVYMMTGR